MNTIKLLSRLTLSALVCLLASCPQDRRLAWSPDGKTGVIVGPKGLQVMNSEGKLGAVIAPEVEAFVWLPDNRSLLVTRKIKVTTWKEAKALLPATEIDQVGRLARALPHLFRAGLELTAGSGDLNDKVLKSYGIDFEAGFPDIDNMWVAAMMAADQAELKAIAQQSKQKPEAIEFPQDMDLTEVALIRLSEKGERVGEPQMIERAVRSIVALSARPQGDCVAYVRGKTGVVRHLASQSAWETPNAQVASCAWSPDGGTLYTMETAGKGNAPGISILTRRGLAFKNNEWTATDPETLVDVILGRDSPAMHVLPDGRILFASMEVRPAEANPGPVYLFVLDPASKRVTRVPTEDALPSLGDGFSVSASGRSVAVMLDSGGIVTVVDVASGGVEAITSADGWDSKTPPEWRGEELYFATAAGKDAPHPDLMRWKRGSPAQNVSGAWTDEMRDSLMTRKPREGDPPAK